MSQSQPNYDRCLELVRRVMEEGGEVEIRLDSEKRFSYLFSNHVFLDDVRDLSMGKLLPPMSSLSFEEQKALVDWVEKGRKFDEAFRKAFPDNQGS